MIIRYWDPWGNAGALQAQSSVPLKELAFKGLISEL